MKFCKYCGAEINDTKQFCETCKLKNSIPAINRFQTTYTVQKSKKTIQTVIKKPWFIVTVAVIALSIVIFAFISNNTCGIKSCSNSAVSGSHYCYTHKCQISGCTSPKLSYSNYCIFHYDLYDDNAKNINTSNLKISDIRTYTKGSYTYSEGTITNNSRKTVTFVKIKGSFKNYSGSVVDTDWTYAVDSEGLAPGESCKWKLSVTKDASIKECTVTVTDYNS